LALFIRAGIGTVFLVPVLRTSPSPLLSPRSVENFFREGSLYYHRPGISRDRSPPPHFFLLQRFFDREDVIFLAWFFPVTPLSLTPGGHQGPISPALPERVETLHVGPPFFLIENGGVDFVQARPPRPYTASFD